MDIWHKYSCSSYWPTLCQQVLKCILRQHTFLVWNSKQSLCQHFFARKTFCIPQRAMLALCRLEQPSKFMKIQNLSYIFARRILVKLFECCFKNPTQNITKLHILFPFQCWHRYSKRVAGLWGAICGKLDWQHYSGAHHQKLGDLTWHALSEWTKLLA